MQQKMHRDPEAGRRGEGPNAGSQGAEAVQALTTRESPSSTAWLMEAICEPANLRYALKRVKAKKVRQVLTVRVPPRPPGPLSPLLSNLLLDDFDKELEKCGLKFARYADDCNIYVKSERSGDRVMARLTHWLNRKLKLKVNAKKSAVARPSSRKFLGYSFRGQKVRCRVSPESVKRFKIRIRELTGRNKGRKLDQVIQMLKRYLTGWKSDYKLNEILTVVRDLNRWVRRRL